MARRSFVVVAVLLLAVGCSADQKGAAPPPPVTSTAAATPASTPTPVASPTPFVSTADEAGAFAFVRSYVDALNAFTAGGASEPLLPYRRSSCRGCIDLERPIKQAYAAGGRIEGGSFTVRQLLLGQSGPSFAKVTIAVTEAPASIVSGDGRREDLPKGQGDLYVLIVREGDHWLTDSLTNGLAS